MKQEVLVAGFGGQGILLMGQLMAEAAMRQGCFATWFPSYGPEMRGGTANCTTIYSDEEIGSPIASMYDTAVVMNQPSLERFAPKVRPGGTLLANATMVPVRCDRDDITALYVPAGDLAKEVGDEKFANVIMLGAFLGVREELHTDCVEQAIRFLVGAKKPELVDDNLQALQRGSTFVAERPLSAAEQTQ
jgi:2-oxoglutarate ferredoxin oxidoreductase subunit gamma